MVNKIVLIFMLATLGCAPSFKYKGAKVECYSGGQKIYAGVTDKRIKHNGFGHIEVEDVSRKATVSVNGDCVVEYWWDQKKWTQFLKRE